MSRPDARGRVYYDPEPDPRFPWYFNVDRADGAPIDYGSVSTWRNAMGCVEQALTMRDMYDNAGPSAEDKDPCANPACPRDDVLDGDDPAAHWATAGSDVIAAWSCSEACSRAVEALRVGGRLPVPH